MHVKINDLSIFYEIIGEGVPIIMIHGYSLDHSSMKYSFEEIFQRKQGYKRIYVDLPAMGLSGYNKTVKNTDDILNIVIKFIDRIIGEEYFIITGMSYGGYLVKGILKNFNKQVLGMQMICPVVIPNYRHRKLPKHEVHHVDDYAKSLPKRKSSGINGCVIQTEEVYNVYMKYIIPAVNKAKSKVLEKIQNHGYSFSFDPDVVDTPYQQPVSLILGKQDSTVGYTDAAIMIPNYSNIDVQLIDHAGHMLQFEQKELFEEHTINWLNAINIYKEDKR